MSTLHIATTVPYSNGYSMLRALCGFEYTFGSPHRLVTQHFMRTRGHQLSSPYDVPCGECALLFMAGED